MSSSSKPVPIGSPRSGDGRETPGRSSPQPFARTPQTGGEFRQFRTPFFGTPPPNIPPRVLRSSPGSGTGSPVQYGSPARLSLMPERAGSRVESPKEENANPFDAVMPPLDLDDLPDEEKAKILRRHLVSRAQRERRGSESSFTGDRRPSASGRVSASRVSSAAQSIHQREDTEPFPILYDAQGADITHDIYKWHSAQRLASSRKRSASFASGPRPTDPAFEHIHEPGGFRRNYMLLKANDQGIEDLPITSTFIDFLYLFGHFAGEDLEEEEDDELEPIPEEDEDLLEGIDYGTAGPSRLPPTSQALLLPSSPSALRTRPGLTVTTRPVAKDDLEQPLSATETSPLVRKSTMRRSLSRSRRRRMSSVDDGEHGDATVAQAVLMLLKSFVGTGVLFLGKAFFNGGLLFSTVTLVFIALISLHSFLLLVKTRFIIPGSFGDIGGELYGPWMRYAILSSITISQLGFVSAYTIFVAENLQAFIMAVTKCATLVPISQLIFVQLVVFLPLAMVRNLAKLSTTALVADAFILVGLVYIFSNEIATIVTNGVADIKYFNETNFPLLIGTAVFSFEGIGLVIPITNSMREPRKFPKVLTGVMIFLTVLFAGAGILSYAAYGSNVQTVVIVNLPQEKKFVQAVQFLYSLAILLSAPLQLFPAVRIMENFLFTRSGKLDPWVKWQKNAFRGVVTLFCWMVSWAGAKDLDKFVSFIGSAACVPLCYVYPAMLHYKACARTRFQKAADIALMAFGFAAALYTTSQTIKLMLSPESGGGPKFGNCPDPADGNVFRPPF